MEEMVKKENKESLDIGSGVPSSLKFGIIVSVALFWVQLLRSIFNDILALLNFSLNILVDFIIALIVTFLGYLILLSHRRIEARLIKMES